MYDPTGVYFRPVLQGLRLAGNTYVRQLAVTSPDGALTLTSETLGLELRAQVGEMRFRDPATGQVRRLPRVAKRSPVPMPPPITPSGRLSRAERRKHG